MAPDGSSDKSDDELNFTESLVINELLASAAHAIDTGKLTTDIVPSFALFYDDNIVKSAHEALSSYLIRNDLKCVKLPSRSRKIDKDDAKTTDIRNMIEALRLIDWQDKKPPFVVSDISRICHVYGALRDEVQMRSEMLRMNQRLSSLEKLLKSIPSLTTRIDTAISVMKPTPPPTPTLSPFISMPGGNFQKPTYKDKVVVNAPKAGQHVKISNENDDDKIATPPSPSWRVAAPRRQQKTKKPPVVGLDDNSGLLSSDVRPCKLFATRFHPDTKAEEMTNYLEKNRGWKVIAVEQLKTKYDSYSSWKLIVNKSGMDKTEIMKPENWPKGVLVRPFLISRKGLQLGRISNSQAPNHAT